MKKALLLILILIPIINHAQNLQFSQSEVSLDFDENLSIFETYLTNPSDQSIELAFKLERICYQEEDDVEISVIFNVGFSFTNQTYTGGTTTPTPLLVAEAQDSVGHFGIHPLNGLLASRWNFIIFDRNDPTNADTMDVKIGGEDCMVTSTNDLHNKIVSKAFPNPVTNTSVIELQNNEGQRLIILSAAGEIVKTIDITLQNEVEINAYDYSAGLYYYYISSDDNRISSIDRFLISK